MGQILYMEYGNHWLRAEENPQLAEMILRSDYKHKTGQYVFTSFSAVLKCGDQNREQNVCCSLGSTGILDVQHLRLKKKNLKIVSVSIFT